MNTRNQRRGIQARRGDGTFGEIVPGAVAVQDPRFTVARGLVATVEIGVEVKILAKAMIKQIDRVSNDLDNQIRQFRKGAGDPICVGIVGINHSPFCTGYEGDRAYPLMAKGMPIRIRKRLRRKRGSMKKLRPNSMSF